MEKIKTRGVHRFAFPSYGGVALLMLVSAMVGVAAGHAFTAQPATAISDNGQMTGTYLPGMQALRDPSTAILGLSASELYYAQKAQEFMQVQQASSAALTSHGLSASEVYYAQKAQEFMQAQQASSAVLTSHGLSASEVYYAQKAQRFMASKTAEEIASLPQ